MKLPKNYSLTSLLCISIEKCINKWLIVNRIIRVILKCLKPFNSVHKKMINKMCLQIIYLIYVYKEDFSLNSLQLFIYNKIKPNPTIKLQAYEKNMATLNI